MHQHGAYYYYVPRGLEAHWDGKKLFRLGATLPEAYKRWAERLGAHDKARTIGELLDRYALEVVPTKAAKSQRENARHIEKLRKVFGKLPLEPFKPRLVYLYVDKRDAKVAAHREIEVLSHAYTKAVEWGYIDRHPFKEQVRLKGEPARSRYVEDWEIVECLALQSRRKKGSVLAVQAYIRLKLLTGMARSDLLRLRLDEHLREDGIYVTRHKTEVTTGKRTIYDYALVPERLEAVKRALAVRPVLSPFLFCTRRGKGYFNETTGLCSGWDSMWSGSWTACSPRPRSGNASLSTIFGRRWEATPPRWRRPARYFSTRTPARRCGSTGASRSECDGWFRPRPVLLPVLRNASVPDTRTARGHATDH
jgi:integrase